MRFRVSWLDSNRDAARKARPDLQHAREGGRDARGQRRAARSAELDVLEPLVREGRRPLLGARARGDVVVRLQLAVDEVVPLRARAAVLVELLRVEDLDGRAGRGAQLELGPAREVLADVVDDDAARGLGARPRRPRVDDADRLVRLRAQHARRPAHDPGRRPARVVEAGLAPARDLAPRVVRLAEVQAVVAARPVGARLPRRRPTPPPASCRPRTRGAARGAGAASRATPRRSSPSPRCASRRRSGPSRARWRSRSRPGARAP